MSLHYRCTPPFPPPVHVREKEQQSRSISGRRDYRIVMRCGSNMVAIFKVWAGHTGDVLWRPRARACAISISSSGLQIWIVHVLSLLRCRGVSYRSSPKLISPIRFPMQHIWYGSVPTMWHSSLTNKWCGPEGGHLLMCVGSSSRSFLTPMPECCCPATITFGSLTRGSSPDVCEAVLWQYELWAL